MLLNPKIMTGKANGQGVLQLEAKNLLKAQEKGLA